MKFIHEISSLTNTLMPKVISNSNQRKHTIVIIAMLNIVILDCFLFWFVTINRNQMLPSQAMSEIINKMNGIQLA